LVVVGGKRGIFNHGWDGGRLERNWRRGKAVGKQECFPYRRGGFKEVILSNNTASRLACDGGK
jgi:hypothetical protein